MAADEVENGEIGTRLLGVPDHIKGPKVIDTLDDRGGVIDVGRCSELARQVADGDSGNFMTQGREAVRVGGSHRSLKQEGG